MGVIMSRKMVLPSVPVSKFIITIIGGYESTGYVTINGTKYLNGKVEVEVGDIVYIYVTATYDTIKTQARVAPGSTEIMEAFGLTKNFMEGEGTYSYNTAVYPVPVTIEFEPQAWGAYYSMQATITETE